MGRYIGDDHSSPIAAAVRRTYALDGGRAGPAASTVLSGLQLLRLMVATVVSVHRDRLGAPLAGLALFVLLVVGLGFLAAPVARLLGRGRALVVAAAGVAVVRLVVQLVPDATARWLLAPAGVVLFLWFVPLWLAGGSPEARDGRGFRLALLVGLALDTALTGLGAGWDYTGRSPRGRSPWPSCSPGPPCGRWPRCPTRSLGRRAAGWRRCCRWSGSARRCSCTSWPGRTSAGRRSWAAAPSQAFLLVMVANLAALAAGTAASLAREVRWPVVGTALAGLAVAVALMGRATVAATVLGQASAAVLVVAIVRRATGPAAASDQGGAAGLGALTAAWTAGMGLFVLLVFAYYAAYDVVLPAGNGWLRRWRPSSPGWPPPESMRGRGGQADRAPGGRAEARPGPGGGRGGAAGGPAGVLSDGARPAAPVQGEGPARPVRVLSYNLHFGFDVPGMERPGGGPGHRGQRGRGGRAPGGLPGLVRGSATDMLAWLQRRLRMPYARFAGASDAIWGNALLSQYPIGRRGGAAARGVRCTATPSGPSSTWGLGGACRWSSPTSTTSRGRTARVRLAQVPRLLELVAGRPATVLMGDLNAEPGSAEIGLLRAAGMADAFAAAGGGPADAPTWPADRPDRRIDWIWLSGDLAATGFAATTSTASDHRGIAVTVRRGLRAARPPSGRPPPGPPPAGRPRRGWRRGAGAGR